jgi:hypothetical protein
LSHHQLFTAYGDGVGADKRGAPLALNPNLYANFSDLFGKVDLWIFGHEHSLNICESFAVLTKGRCVGASAVPVQVADNPYEANNALQQLPGGAPVLKKEVNGNELRLSLSPADGDFQHCFAVLALGDPNSGSEAKYYQIDSTSRAMETLFYSESI